MKRIVGTLLGVSVLGCAGLFGADIGELRMVGEALEHAPPEMQGVLLVAGLAEIGVFSGSCGEGFRAAATASPEMRAAMVMRGFRSCPGDCPAGVDFDAVAMASPEQKKALVLEGCNSVGPDDVFSPAQAKSMSWLDYLVYRTAFEAVKDDLDRKGTAEAAEVWKLYEATIPNVASASAE